MSTVYTLPKRAGLGEAGFTCPVCYAVMDKQVCQCKTGRFVCPTCFYKLQKGKGSTNRPTCRIELDQEPIRCLLIEKLYPLMSLECKNKMDGCDFHGTHNEIKEDLKKCKFKRVTCLTTLNIVEKYLTKQVVKWAQIKNCQIYKTMHAILVSSVFFFT